MKKSLLILPSIILLFLVNACTPLPTGGPVSANVIYNLYNKNYVVSNSDFANSNIDTFYVDVNNDSYEDLMINSCGWWVRLKVINGIEFATVTDFANYGAIKSFALNTPISSNETYGNTEFTAIFGNVLNIINPYTSEIYGTNPDHYIGYNYFDGSYYYYGWIRIYVNTTTHSATVIESAYNTIPNQPILSGKK